MDSADTQAFAKPFNSEEEARSSRIDAIVRWPANADLRAILPDLQRLNPGLGIDCALTHRPAADREINRVRDGVMTSEIEHFDGSESEFLIWSGSPLEPVVVAMPAPPTDCLLGGLTRVNRDQDAHDTDHGLLHNSQWRFERTASGSLLMRPISWPVAMITSMFGWAYQCDQTWSDHSLGRVQYRWGIVRPSDEVWEVEFAYLGPKFRYVRNESPNPDWTTIPVGTISYVDRHDLPLEDHHARARAILAMGAQFAAVGDIERGEMLVFRPFGVERFADNVRLPEMNWFDVPIRKKSLDC